jgi:hypothetical protein
LGGIGGNSTVFHTKPFSFETCIVAKTGLADRLGR